MYALGVRGRQRPWHRLFKNRHGISTPACGRAAPVSTAWSMPDSWRLNPSSWVQSKGSITEIETEPAEHQATGTKVKQ